MKTRKFKFNKKCTQQSKVTCGRQEAIGQSRIRALAAVCKPNSVQNIQTEQTPKLTAQTA